MTKKSAIVIVRFMDGHGRVLPCKGLAESKYGPYFYIDSSKDGLRFSRTLVAPRHAVRLDVYVRRWNADELSLMDFSLDVAVKKPGSRMWRLFKGLVPKDGMLRSQDVVHETLVNWVGSDEVLTRIKSRQDTPEVHVANYSLVWDEMWPPDAGSSRLKLKDFKDIAITPEITWLENPFNSTTWQLKYATGIWISPLAMHQEKAAYYRHCKAYWTSFFKNNTFPNNGKPIYGDHATAGRVEAILMTMYGAKNLGHLRNKIPSIQHELSKDASFFKQMLYQLYTDVELLDYFLRNEIYLLHNHNLIMASALLAFSECFSDFEFAGWYRDTAKEVIVSHLREMFEPDGFIREQSALYHHTFTKLFLDLSASFPDVVAQVPEWKEWIQRIVAADALLTPPDGYVLPIGDTGRNEIRNVLKKSTNIAMSRLGMRLDYPSEFRNCPSNSVFRESGLYIFRNPELGRMFFVDLSTVRKVHGHYDMGNWLYYADKSWWVTDLGGPWRYGTKEYRSYVDVDSHNVFRPLRRKQTLGEAYDIKLDEKDDQYILRCKTNVYGPDYDAALRYHIMKDLSAVAVRTEFVGEGRFMGNVFLGFDVGIRPYTTDPTRSHFYLTNGVGNANIAFSPKWAPIKIGTGIAAPRGIEQKPVTRLNYQIAAEKGKAVAVVGLGLTTNTVFRVMKYAEDEF